MRLSKKYIIGIMLFFSIFLSIYFLLALYIGFNAGHDTKSQSDIILVLGAKSYHGNAYNPCLVSRVAHAVDLYKRNYAPKILVSGGFDKEDNINEAETMKKIAIEGGVKVQDIFLEKKATSTYENFIYSRQILNKSKLTSVIIVTEPFHSPRAGFIAKKIGMNFTVSPASESPCWLKGKYVSKYFLKEPLAIMLYKLQGEL